MELMKKGNTREVSTTTANTGARLQVSCGEFGKCWNFVIKL